METSRQPEKLIDSATFSHIAMTQEDYKARRREKTREAAAALVDDLSFFRDVLVKEAPTAGDIRRLSAQLRRILVDGTLEKVAGPRVGKIRLLAPVIDEVVRLNREQPYEYVSVGYVTMFGIEVSWAILERGTKPRALKDFRPDALQELDPEHFMKQGVMVFQGTWITRREILRYMANVAEGIHSGEPKNYTDRLIRRARHMSKMSLDGGVPVLTMNVAPITEINLPPLLSKTDIDGALVELWAAADLLTKSPDIRALEAYIDVEQ